MILTSVVREKDDIETELNKKLVELHKLDCDVRDVKISTDQNNKVVALITYNFEGHSNGTFDMIMADIDKAINGIV
ncbi:hypothetical protein [Culicoidibacter larvae]|uniref:Uncharacterized protein n=1 Tax=Culicoidibacter larvae TaxID=2579976 RepID=A0A5R8QGC3_9FIRM|nr:hypothetical protein [Culicoidibacter larvae]TLG77089.1 hypothetical protein FEZ08_00290 [Culicoidibacter larvae]